jgi:hypothetical protein
MIAGIINHANQSPCASRHAPRKKFEIEHPKFEIKTYFCGVKSVLPTILPAHVFTGLNNRTTGTLTIQFFCKYDHQLHQVAGHFIAG